MKIFFMQVIIVATGIVTETQNKHGNSTRTAFNRFSTKHSSTRNIAYYKEIIAI
jgi:hypothetical protein